MVVGQVRIICVFCKNIIMLDACSLCETSHYMLLSTVITGRTHDFEHMIWTLKVLDPGNNG